jgi:hypothetical protein
MAKAVAEFFGVLERFLLYSFYNITEKGATIFLKKSFLLIKSLGYFQPFASKLRIVDNKA